MSYQILPYNQSLALFTDLYEITMGYGYWKLGRAEDEAVFNLFFRKNPFNGGFTIAAGLELVIDFLNNFNLTDDDIEYLGSLNGDDDKPLFSADFLEYLRNMEITCDIEAVPEGTIVFPHQPIIRVKGPIIQCQILETLLLNIINFHSLIATKAARVCISTNGEPVLEFGARRAQGIDGGLSASRAAYIGGCVATSNILAGKLYNIPVKGTHAHSWILCFNNELESFRKYAEAMPNNCVFLVDTYDTKEGIKNAIKVAQELDDPQKQFLGIRLDSGDLAYLSSIARKMLDKAGFPNAKIFASNDLDEHIIRSLKSQHAQIAVWGVGTNLVTSSDQSALGGVYKITAIKENDEWEYKIKLSEQTVKISTPGILQVRRFFDRNGQALGDAVYDENITSLDDDWVILDPKDPYRQRIMNDFERYEDLMVPITKKGKVVYQTPGIQEIQQRVKDQLELFHSGVKRFINPHSYPAGLEQSVQQKKIELISRLKNISLDS